jgi:hypothetical protein
MAKILCPIGGDGKYSGQVMHGILEAVPSKPWCQVGQETELQVFMKENLWPSKRSRLYPRKRKGDGSGQGR